MRSFEIEEKTIIILPHLNHLHDWVEPISPATETLLQRYWPGPITFVFNKKSTVPDYLTAGKPTIAIRICDFLPVNLLMKALQQPILSTSANPHGQPVAQSIDDCDPSIIDAVDHSFNGCTAYYNQPSTIIDLTVTPPQQLRKGVVPFES